MNTTTSHHLSRPTDDRILAGVASGLARYAGIDAVIVRIAFAALTLLGGAGIPLYLICWLLIPAEGSGKSVAAGLAADLRGGNL
jgi:phage shock protein PspC (stress-responsive transcriptional regulator)